ncbi:MAG TPA: hypothetical protein VGK59_06990 [Ohtaekwangia sp.]
MKAKHTLFILLLLLLTVACSDDSKPEPDFVPGDVLIGIKSTVTAEQVFDLMNGKQAFIYQMSGFYQHSTFPNDSLDFVVEELTDKSYFNTMGFSGGNAFIDAIDNRITVTQMFFNMNLSNQQDWLETMDKLQLVDEEGSKHVLIKVKPGREDETIEIFKSHEYVAWAMLNYNVRVGPMTE